MKRSLILLLSLFAFFNSFAQSDSLFTITIESGVDNKDMKELMSFMDIEKQKIKLIGNALDGKRVNIGYKEYKNGKVISTRLLTEGELLDKYFRAGKGDTQFSFNVLASSDIIDSTIKVHFFYPIVNFHYFQEGLDKSGYSLRVLQDNKNVQYKLGKQIPILCYSLPYKIEGTNGSSYCILTAEDVPPSEWYDKYKVAHYIVYYLEVL